MRYCLVVVALLMAGCQAGEDGSVAEGRSGDAFLGAASALAEVMEADRRFAREVSREGLDAWVRTFAEDGAVIPASGPIATGHVAIKELMSPAFGVQDFSLVWEPLGGAASRSGELAYTYGDYETSDDSGVVTRGRYVTVWRRDDDGVWRVLADIGNREPAPSTAAD